MGRGVRILHISDLHMRVAATPHGDRWRTVGSQWLANLGALRADGRPFDVVAFTGDLGDAGHATDYPDALRFLREVCETLEVDTCRLFVVPGNHDITRDHEAEAWAALREAVTTASAREVSAWMAGGAAPPGFDDGWRDAVGARASAFWAAIVDDLGRSELAPGAARHPRLGYRATISLDASGGPVHLIGLDSAWLAGDDADVGSLRLTEHQVDLLTSDEQGRSLPGLRIALMHHRFADLADGAAMRRLLGRRVDLVLHGHQRATTSAAPAASDDGTIVLAAGGLYLDPERRHQNALQVIDVEVADDGRPHTVAIRFRSWSDIALRWTDDALIYPQVSDGGLRVRRTLHGWVSGDPPPPPLRLRPANPIAVGDEPISRADAIALVRAELDDPDAHETPIADLAKQVGHVPIALRLACGHLRAGHAIDQFLLEVATYGKKPAQRSRASSEAVPRSLEDVVNVCLALLGRQAGTRGARWVAAYTALAWAPASGFDRDLAAAITDLDDGSFELDELLAAAVELSLLDRAADTWTMPPSVAALLQPRTTRKSIDDRVRRRGDLRAALEELPSLQREAEALDRRGDHARLAATRTRIAAILRDSGQRLAALDVLRHDVLPLQRDDLAAQVATLDAIAALLARRDQLDEAVAVLRRQCLPLHDRLGDLRARAATVDLLADLYMQRGDTVDALRLRLDEELALLDRLGDLAARAACLNKIAHIYRLGGMTELAITFFRAALDALAAPHLAAVRAAVACDLALTLRHRGKEPDYAEAFTLLSDALALARTHDAPCRDRIEAECARLGIR